MLEMLNVLERLDLRGYGQSSADALHLIAEAQRSPGPTATSTSPTRTTSPQPTDELISKGYAARRRGEIALTRDALRYAPGDVGTPQRRARPPTSRSSTRAATRSR